MVEGKTERLQDSRREKLNDDKIAEGKNLATTLSNHSYRFMTIFSNLINQGVASHSKKDVTIFQIEV